MHYSQSKDQERYRSEEVIVDGKISFWKFGQEVVLRGKTEPVAGKTADKSVAADYTDFKEHVWRELSVIKAKVTQNQLSSDQVYEATFTKNLNERVVFFGKIA